ncbi:MAG: response regulator transcription factor [Holophagaceae bacterium]|uniref:Response regulator transcription factor n=1 Tax=Candidatus Geothrix skivensis TaxID=2954439 RepID=A0A9D7SGD2_9BACT|nr:response regulator transcription factor [Candidatus Geothrix skivensis]
MPGSFPGRSAEPQALTSADPMLERDLLVLVVEDEPLARLSIRTALTREGFSVLEAESGEESLVHFDRVPSPDVVILDIGLPGLDGFQVCQRIRSKREDTAILMLTARADPSDKITGLTLGADDYIVKPFNPGELVARIRAVLRRSAQRTPSLEPLDFGELHLDVQTQKAFKGGVDVNLSPREFALLAALIRHSGQVMSRDQLGREVWGETRNGSARALDVFVCKLRDKIEDDPSNPTCIRTVRGMGYVCG